MTRLQPTRSNGEPSSDPQTPPPTDAHAQGYALHFSRKELGQTIEEGLSLARLKVRRRGWHGRAMAELEDAVGEAQIEALASDFDPRQIADRAERLVYNRLRRAETKRRRPMTAEPESTDNQPTPLERAEFWGQIRQQVGPDPEGKKFLSLLLAYWMNLTHAEIAAVLVENEATVSQRLKRVKARLRKTMATELRRSES